METQNTENKGRRCSSASACRASAVSSLAGGPRGQSVAPLGGDLGSSPGKLPAQHRGPARSRERSGGSGTLRGEKPAFTHVPVEPRAALLPRSLGNGQGRASANPETAESRRPTRSGRGCLLTSDGGTCPTFCLRLVSRKRKTEIISCHRTRTGGSPADGPREEGAGPRTGFGKRICAQRTAHVLKGRPERRHRRCSAGLRALALGRGQTERWVHGRHSQGPKPVRCDRRRQ